MMMIITSHLVKNDNYNNYNVVAHHNNHNKQSHNQLHQHNITAHVTTQQTTKQRTIHNTTLQHNQTYTSQNTHTSQNTPYIAHVQYKQQQTINFFQTQKGIKEKSIFKTHSTKRTAQKHTQNTQQSYFLQF